MKLDDHIAYAIRTYPSLYSNRTQVLQHLFCVIGNGYDWHEGTLASHSFELDGPVLTLEQAEEEYQRSLLERSLITDPEELFQEQLRKMGTHLGDIPPNLLQRWREDAEYTCAWHRRVEREYRTLALRTGGLHGDPGSTMYRHAQRMKKAGVNEPESVYPMCQYSALTQLPDDIEFSWLGGALEAAEDVLRIDSPIVLSSTSSEHARERARKNCEYAEAAIARVEEILAARGLLPTPAE
jgi:hypothetical protein